MKHFTHISDLGVDGVMQVLETAARWKRESPGEVFAGKVLGMLFFNPSLRTRVSFETAMLRTGGNAVVLNVDGSIWKLEDRAGIMMDADRPEHIKDAIPVLGRYLDALAVRTFAASADQDVNEQDSLMRQIRQYSNVPVVSMESAREHPCQGLADMLTIQEKLGNLQGQPITLTWAPHIKPLPQAVPNSFLLTAAACGCNITVAHPTGFELHPKVLSEAQSYAASSGASISFTDDQQAACRNAKVVYAKSWSPSLEFPATTSATKLIEQHADWLVDTDLLSSGGQQALFMHCLPVRRNVVVTDAVLDSPASVVVDQAENRYHVQRAVLNQVFDGATL